jgi:hypothetical protein
LPSQATSFGKPTFTDTRTGSSLMTDVFSRKRRM